MLKRKLRLLYVDALGVEDALISLFLPRYCAFYHHCYARDLRLKQVKVLSPPALSV